ncbi:TetR/AcrR family transcriptional regulator [Pikeienuella piscinae]|uniref:TetR/AcrR family transcriptional regulator n=1 Tax=Pikeienuella piscinae TaxID=2748098 RepID=A0A7L5BXM6_9RHOB|nr:TetR/AcrR family transcriptional regulator [Pikeienuella piscinae]QIE55006.1 TetR/AcrR family transcriptional regulator [Pikeienuella piscinae]
MTLDVNKKDGSRGAVETIRRDPDGTKKRILDAATHEFSTKGLGGARIADIADRAGVNKRMLYHYFGDKDALFLVVLEGAYAAIRRREREMALDHLPPEEAMRRLVETTWDHYIEHPEFLNLLNSENLHKARHLRNSTRAREMHSPFADMIAQILRRGEDAKVFRAGVDPVDLYISIAGLGYFYLSNRYTLSVIFDRDLEAPDNLARRRAHMVEVVLGYLRRSGGVRPRPEPDRALA